MTMDPTRLALVERLLAEGRAHDAQQTERDLTYRNLEQVSGEFLHLLMHSLQPASVLEVGTSNGYSTIWLADALPEGGRLVTVDNDEQRHAEAVANLAEAGLADRVELVLGDAARLIVDTPDDSVDLVFLDADRSVYVAYWPELQRLLAPHGLLVVDNCTSHADDVADFRALVDSTEGVESTLVPLGAGLLFVSTAH